MTHLQIIDLIERICIYYPHASIQANEKTVHAWFDMLGECEADHVVEKFKSHVKSGNRYPPTVAELYVSKPERDNVKTYEETQRLLKEREQMNQTAKNYTPEQRETVNRAKQHIKSILRDSQPNA